MYLLQYVSTRFQQLLKLPIQQQIQLVLVATLFLIYAAFTLSVFNCNLLALLLALLAAIALLIAIVLYFVRLFAKYGINM